MSIAQFLQRKATSQAADTSKYADNGSGCPSYNEQNKGKHVGDVVAFEYVVNWIVTGPVAKDIDASNNKPTDVKHN